MVPAWTFGFLRLVGMTGWNGVWGLRPQPLEVLLCEDVGDPSPRSPKWASRPFPQPEATPSRQRERGVSPGR